MNEVSDAVRATAAVCPSQAAEAWVLAALSPELEPRPLDAAVEVACFWGERLLEVRCVGEGERWREDGLVVALRGGCATVEGPGTALAGGGSLAQREAPLSLGRGERAVLAQGPLSWGVRFVRAPRPLMPEPLAPAEVRFFKYTAMALLGLVAGLAASLVAEGGFGDAPTFLTPRMIRAVVQSAATPALPRAASQSAIKLERQQAPATPSVPSKNAAPPRGTPDTKAAMKAMVAGLFAGESGRSVFAPGGLDAALDAPLNALGAPRAGVAAEGLAGLGARGTGAGGGDRVFGIGSVGTTGGSTGVLIAGRSHDPVRVLVGPVLVTDGLDRDVIRRVIHRHESEVKFCYESALSRNAALGGKVMVSFVIGSSGDVASAVVGESTVSDEAFAACLVERVRTWRFPAPAGGGEVQVNYPWVVKVAGSEE